MTLPTADASDDDATGEDAAEADDDACDADESEVDDDACDADESEADESEAADEAESEVDDDAMTMRVMQVKSMTMRVKLTRVKLELLTLYRRLPRSSPSAGRGGPGGCLEAQGGSGRLREAMSLYRPLQPGQLSQDWTAPGSLMLRAGVKRVRPCSGQGKQLGSSALTRFSALDVPEKAE